MTDPNGWLPFDYENPPDGLCWIEVERPERCCDAGDDGRAVGGYTGKTHRVVVLTEVYETDEGPAFGDVAYGDLGSVRDDDKPLRFLRLTPPEPPHDPR